MGKVLWFRLGSNHSCPGHGPKPCFQVAFERLNQTKTEVMALIHELIYILKCPVERFSTLRPLQTLWDGNRTKIHLCYLSNQMCVCPVCISTGIQYFDASHDVYELSARKDVQIEWNIKNRNASWSYHEEKWHGNPPLHTKRFVLTSMTNGQTTCVFHRYRPSALPENSVHAEKRKLILWMRITGMFRDRTATLTTVTMAQ